MRFMAFLILFVATPAWANDTAWGGTPGDLFPIQTSDVAMVEEHIVMRQNSKDWAWEVRVEFTFKNVGKKPVEITMGFPFYTYDPESPSTQPKGTKDVKENDPMVWDFTTQVDGKSVRYEKQAVKANPAFPELHYKWAYVWPTKFEPGQTIKVANSYRQGITQDSSGYIWPTYILRTGGMWHGGKIGRSHIEIFGDSESLPCQDEGFFKITPEKGNLKRKPEGPKWEWDLKDHKPTTDVEACFRSRDHIRNVMFYELEDTDYSKMSVAELRILRNTVFAFHGYEFKSDDLKKHFAKQWYYYPNKKFRNSDLTEEERAFVKAVQARERELSAAPAKP